jgi:asparagine synthase (glutamine-hydrolysing)
MIAPPGALPGKVEHIAALSRSHGVREGRDRVRLGPLRMPLLSQPVIETSLRIPSWMNVTGGRNRAVARDAFAISLPPEIVQRKTKGSFAGLNAAILEHNRARIKDLLLGGRMHEKGILDSPVFERRLAASEELTDGQCSALLELACAELWTHDW